MGSYLFISALILAYVACVIGVKQCPVDIYDTKIQTSSKDFPVLVIWFATDAGHSSGLRLCANNAYFTVRRQCAKGPRGRRPTWDVVTSDSFRLNCPFVADVCEEESFRHYYVMEHHIKRSNTNKWPTAIVGEMVASQELCLLKTGLPLLRKCVYNPMNNRVEWEAKEYTNITCLRHINENIITPDLHKVYQEIKRKAFGLSSEEILKFTNRIVNLLSDRHKVRIAADLAVAYNVLIIIIQSSRSDPTVLPGIIKLYNLLLQSHEDVVRRAKTLGSDSMILETVETYLDNMANVVVPSTNCQDIPGGVVQYLEDHTSVFYVNPLCSNISGIALYRTLTHGPESLNHYDKSTNRSVRFLYLNTSLITLMNETDLEVATYISSILWLEMRRTDGAKVKANAVRISFYRSWMFFIQNEPLQEIPLSVVVRIGMPGRKDSLTRQMPLIYHNDEFQQVDDIACATWNYHNHSDIALPLGGETMIRCNARRLPIYAAVYRFKSTVPDQSDDHDVLTVPVTSDLCAIVGCVISLLSFPGVWVIGIFCKQWSTQMSNKHLQNICLVLTLLIVYLLLNNIPQMRVTMHDRGKHLLCIAEGAFLQYTMLVFHASLFLLVFQQYLRYQEVFNGKRVRSLSLRYILATWGVPLIATVIALFMDAKSYRVIFENPNNSRGLCHPSGLSLYFTSILPMLMLMITNMGIFAYIVSSYRWSLKKFHNTNERTNTIVEIHLTMALVIVLSVSWLFAVWAHTVDVGVSSWFFCLTSILQAVVLFVYLAVLDESERYAELKCRCGKVSNVLEVASISAVTRFKPRLPIRNFF